jgi:hypothetical protein
MNEPLISTRASLRGLVLLTVVALLAGCQSGGSRPDASAESSAAASAAGQGDAAAGSAKSADPLLARANERWQLLIASKFAEAYDYLSPGYREVVEREEYVQTMARRQVFWNQAVAGDRECAGQVCRVRVDVQYKVNMPVMGVGEVESATTVIENWIAGSDGRWYFVPSAVR